MLPCALVDLRGQTLIGIGEAKQPLLGSRVLHAACLCARPRSAIVPMLQIGFVVHLASAPWRAAKSSPAGGPPDHARAGDEGGCRRVICPAPRDDSTGAGKHAKIAKCVGYDDGDVHRLIHRSLFLRAPQEGPSRSMELIFLRGASLCGDPKPPPEQLRQRIAGAPAKPLAGASLGRPKKKAPQKRD